MGVVPSGGVQQPGGSIPSGRFSSNNLLVALSQMPHGSGVTNRGGINVVGNHAFSSSNINGVTGSITGISSSSAYGNRSSVPGLGVSPVLSNVWPRLISSVGNIVGSGNMGRSISSGGLSVPGLASRVNLAIMHRARRIMLALVEDAKEKGPGSQKESKSSEQARPVSVEGAQVPQKKLNTSTNQSQNLNLTQKMKKNNSCNKKGPYKNECPKMRDDKPKLARKKKALKATWDESSSKESDVEDHKYHNYLTLMATRLESKSKSEGESSHESVLISKVCGKSNVNPQSRDLVLQLVERILSGPKAQTIMLNGAVRKGERIVPPAVLDLLMRATFPASTARVKTTERFETFYPTLKELALTGYGTKTTKQASQQLLPFAIQAIQENNSELTKEATDLFIWCLTQNAECYKQWVSCSSNVLFIAFIIL
ncbi:uncharacterized protein LOC122033863 [Zingiber officinale]|uniref:uncharacterized protein LOC122033863 n=1 Tax=Zingiber officinale TaxID=94328 RepID=UPI001C4BC71C|nr:uncharacterized protein LOC122033863 [Zingiber officinale]